MANDGQTDDTPQADDTRRMPNQFAGQPPARSKGAPIAGTASDAIADGRTHTAEAFIAVTSTVSVDAPLQWNAPAGEYIAREVAGRRDAEAVNRGIIQAVLEAGRAEGLAQAEQHLVHPQPPSAPSQTGAQRAGKDPRRPSPATQAAARAIANYQHEKGLSLTADASLLAQDIMDDAVRNELPDAELLNLRSVTLLVAAAQDGVRRSHAKPLRPPDS